MQPAPGFQKYYSVILNLPIGSIGINKKIGWSTMLNDKAVDLKVYYYKNRAEVKVKPI